MNIADHIKSLLEALPIPTKASLDRRREERAEAEAEAEAEIGDAGVDDAASDLLTAEMPGDEAPGAPPEAPEAPSEVPEMPEVPPKVPSKSPAPEPESEEEPSGPEKTERIDMRIKPSDKAEIEAAASNLGLTVSAYVMFLHKSYGGRVGMPSPVQQQPQPQPQQQQQSQ